VPVPLTLLAMAFDGDALKRNRAAGTARAVFLLPSEGRDTVLLLPDQGAALILAL
jgi:hypothetical protein